ncbi:ABC transporter permease [Cryptosporangium aurantiacum]|uniref:ABC-2 type transport system permease protein n=1 Tax=Cryptosporangium aurantiacum TaxID=134849 RepID=A0A1M7R7A5_9ACTN|nr:ABC transporter permease [Cryptosporangium aurantiacum]SHN42187.1 ABC-2 type transport system permease protein [Cryptosporangium aurantiacum]
MSGVIARITVRGLLGRRRFLLLLPLPLLLIAAASIGRISGVSPSEWAEAVLTQVGFAVVLPLIALIVGTGVLGSELEDGSAVTILTTPVSRGTIVLTKLAVAIGITTVATAVPMFIAGVIVDSARLGVGLAVGAFVGTVAYTTLFIALSVISRRPVLIALGYLVIWEGTLVSILSGVRWLSIRQFASAVGDRAASTELLSVDVPALYAVLATAVLAVAATTLAIDRLSAYSVRGETG